MFFPFSFLLEEDNEEELECPECLGDIIDGECCDCGYIEDEDYF